MTCLWEHRQGGTQRNLIRASKPVKGKHDQAFWSIIQQQEPGLYQKFVSLTAVVGWEIAVKHAHMPSFTCSLERISSFLLLQNVFAAPCRTRPTISCIGRLTDRVSWFLNKIVSPLLSKVPSHLMNTNQFLERIRNTSFGQDCVMESFDVTSLYTNVSNSVALLASSEMFDLHGRSMKTYGLSESRIITLIKECLECSSGPAHTIHR